MNELEIKWRMTGLLDGSKEEHVEELSQDLERCKDYLLSLTGTMKEQELEELSGRSLPAVVRISLEKNIRGLDMSRLVNDLKTWWISKKELQQDLINSNIACDYEAEMMCLFCENYSQ